MAVVGVMGPYQHTDALAPGEKRWVDLEAAEGFEHCALSVTASPIRPGPGGGTMVMKVDDLNMTALPGPPGVKYKYQAGFNVTNTGETTIAEWSVLVGVIRP